MSGHLSVKGKNEMKRRYLEVQSQVISSVKAREKNFVEAEFCDEKIDGVLDKSLIVEEVLFGKTYKGIWKYVGRQGVWEGIETEQKVIVDRRVEGSGIGEMQQISKRRF